MTHKQLTYASFTLNFSSSSVEKVIDWLLEKEELQRTYKLLTDNCQHFAKRLFETVAKTKKYPRIRKTIRAIWDSMNLAAKQSNVKKCEKSEGNHP